MSIVRKWTRCTPLVNVDESRHRNGQAGIYMATDLRYNVRIIAKSAFDNPKNDQEAEKLKMLGNECVILSGIRSQFVVNYLGYCQSKSVPEFDGRETFDALFEFSPNRDLASLVRDHNGGLEEICIRDYAREILLALRFLHSIHIVHGNIQCSHILIGTNGKRVKLASFGLAFKVQPTAVHSRLVASLMTRGFLGSDPPETIILKKRCLSGDIYSLGCAVIEMITGQIPDNNVYKQAKKKLRDPDHVAKYFAVRAKDGLVDIQIPTTVSQEGQDFLRKCLDRRPDHRPTAQDLLDHPFVRTAGNNLRVNRKRQLSPERTSAICRPRRFEGSDLNDFDDSEVLLIYREMHPSEMEPFSARPQSIESQNNINLYNIDPSVYVPRNQNHESERFFNTNSYTSGLRVPEDPHAHRDDQSIAMFASSSRATNAAINEAFVKQGAEFESRIPEGSNPPDIDVQAFQNWEDPHRHYFSNFAESSYADDQSLQRDLAVNYAAEARGFLLDQLPPRKEGNNSATNAAPNETFSRFHLQYFASGNDPTHIDSDTDTVFGAWNEDYAQQQSPPAELGSVQLHEQMVPPTRVFSLAQPAPPPPRRIAATTGLSPAQPIPTTVHQPAVAIVAAPIDPVAQSIAGAAQQPAGNAAQPSHAASTRSMKAAARRQGAARVAARKSAAAREPSPASLGMPEQENLGDPVQGQASSSRSQSQQENLGDPVDGQASSSRRPSQQENLGDPVQGQASSSRRQSLHVHSQPRSSGRFVAQQGAGSRYTKHQTDVLDTWMRNNLAHSYPTQEEKKSIAEESGITDMKWMSIWMKEWRATNATLLESNARPTDKLPYNLEPEQKLKLSEWARENSLYPSKVAKNTLAVELGMPLRRVNTWFARTRSKVRKLMLTDSQPVPPRAGSGRQFTPEQRRILLDAFNISPNLLTVDNLANETGLTNEQIRNWFSNRRKLVRVKEKFPMQARLKDQAAQALKDVLVNSRSPNDSDRHNAQFPERQDGEEDAESEEEDEQIVAQRIEEQLGDDEEEETEESFDELEETEDHSMNWA